ncbi:hypothetical protein [Embleya scabrispora]|nr:hypothetical protein [Embleya scabrispora]MYS86760.1 hypothetical protein [Streptomyces sp. SID5474]
MGEESNPQVFSNRWADAVGPGIPANGYVRMPHTGGPNTGRPPTGRPPR